MISRAIQYFSIPKISFSILGVYFILCILYSYERILNIDNSYFFFEIVNGQHLWFPENRYGILFSQLPLFLFAHLGFSLKTLLYTYSLSFPVEYIAIALICHFYLKVKEGPLVIALTLVLGIAFGFLHPVTETYHALIFSVLLYCVLVSEKFSGKQILFYFWVFLTSALSLISHPIGVFAVGFVAVFSFVSKQTGLRPTLFVLALSIASLLLRVLLVPKGSYDIQQYDNLFLSLSDPGNIGSLYPVIYLKAHSTDVYLSTILLAVVFSILSVKFKRFGLWSLSVSACICFAVMGILTFSKGDADIMMEKTFMPAIFMLTLPLGYLYKSADHIKKTIMLPVVVLFIASLSFIQIIKASHIATRRLNALQVIAKQESATKIIGDFSDFDDPALHFNHWNTGIDSYILARCKLHKSFTLFLIDDKNAFPFDSTSTTLFLGPTWYPHWEKGMLNQTYFLLPEDTYKIYHHD